MIGVFLQYGDTLFTAHIPEAGCAIHAGAGKQFTLWVKAERPDDVLMAPQNAHRSKRFPLPQADDVIYACAGEQAPIRRESDRIDLSRMPLQEPKRLATISVPDMDIVIIAT